MRTHIGRWGNSLAVRIPLAFAREAQLEEGATVEVSLFEDGLVIRPIGRSHNLDTLVSGITEENLHGETDWGRPLGNEAW